MPENVPAWVEQIIESQAEIKAELVALTAQVRETNGRVAKLEAWRREVIAETEKAAAYARGAATALVTKGQWRIIAGFFGAVGVVAGAMAGVIKLLEMWL